MLELQDIKFTYEGTKSTYEFNLRVEPGEIVAVTGTSGSGKSTLLDLISGFLLPSSGRMQVDGQNLLPHPPQSRPVSILFQNDNLFDHLSVQQNLVLGLPSATPKNAHHAILNNALQEVELAGFQNQPTTQLSGGQKQRVGLARTLIRQKPILLLDEPFSGLDHATAQTMRALVKKLTVQHNWHTIIVSHTPADAQQLANRAYALADNKLVLVS